MAIKKRPSPADRAADIEAFGNAALESDSFSRETPISATPSVPRAANGSSSVSRQLLVRFPDQDMPRALEELAARDDRSKHYMALAALRIGIAHLQNPPQA